MIKLERKISLSGTKFLRKRTQESRINHILCFLERSTSIARHKQVARSSLYRRHIELDREAKLMEKILATTE